MRRLNRDCFQFVGKGKGEAGLSQYRVSQSPHLKLTMDRLQHLNDGGFIVVGFWSHEH